MRGSLVASKLFCFQADDQIDPFDLRAFRRLWKIHEADPSRWDIRETQFILDKEMMMICGVRIEIRTT